VRFWTTSDPIDPREYVIAFEGRLERGEAGRLRALLFELIDVGARSITVDLTRTRTVDETAVGILIIADKALRQRGGNFHVVADGWACSAENLLIKRGEQWDSQGSLSAP